MSFSSGKNAARREERRQRAEENRRRLGVMQVNSLFGVNTGNQAYDARAAKNAEARKALMDRLFSDVLAYHKGDITRAGDIAQRNLKFNLARTGNLGGSVDVDKNAELGGLRDRQLLAAANEADKARSAANSSDEATRMDLIRQISSGLDANVALESGSRALAQNVKDAGFNARAATLGDAFSQFADALPYATLSERDPSSLYQPRRRRTGYGSGDSGTYVSG